jgi:hypothetical protein
MYKDKDKQRAAVKEATKRWRVSRRVSPKVSPEEGITNKGITGITQDVTLVTIENVKQVVAALPVRDWRKQQVRPCRLFNA